MLIGRPSGALRPEINLPQKDGIAAPITKAHNSRDMRLAVTSVSLSPRLLDDSYRFLPSKVSSGLEFRSSSRERKEGRKGRWRRSGFFCWPSNFEGTVLSLFNARFLELGPRDNATWYSRGRSKSGARAGIPVERAKHRSLLPSVSLHEPCV